MTYYEGSQITVEWTVQHGCGLNPRISCNMVLQYMCSTKDADPTVLVRDGTTTDTITDDATGPVAVDGNGDLLFGMHESYEYYQECKRRERNMGLFIADREEEGNLNAGRRSAIFTRQNNNGNRHGYECVEERDYYPYWHPSPWRDVAIMTADESYCKFYKRESQNVQKKGYCVMPADKIDTQENNPITCAAEGGTWTEQPSWGIPAPLCIQSAWSRENHLGSGPGGYVNSVNVTLAKSSHEECIGKDNCNCVLRIRYNISNAQLGENGNRPDAGFIDWTMNAERSPVQNDEIISQDGAAHELALDTTQFGRTFQDRTHVYHVKPRPGGVKGTARIFNINVRGKRGNIVQAYPATEYDFTPTMLNARVGDYIHFQWSGCDTNPAGNAGEGTDQTDRSNVVQISDHAAAHPATDEWIKSHTPMFQSKELRLRMAMLGQTDCLTYEELLAKNNNDNNQVEQDVQNCMKLNSATQYFDAGLIKFNLTGDFAYMSTRNHNFSNRDQKGQLNIVPLLPTWAIAVVSVGAALFVGSAGVAGLMLYAKSHPHSGVANLFTKI
jgi:hypothetical protein